MDTAGIAERLRARFGTEAVTLTTETADPFITVPVERLAEVCRFLQEDPEIRLDGFSSLSGVDWPEEGKIDVVYHLVSYLHGHLCTLKTRLARDNPKVPSVEAIWKAANWFEREAYDLLGIRFLGHPNLRRLLMPEDWVGHPLRKDYVEQASYHGMETTREDPLDILKPAPWGPAPQSESDAEAEAR